MTNVEAWPILIGIITPFLVSIITRSNWSSQTKRLIQITVSIIIGTVTAYFDRQFDNFIPQNLLSTIIILYGSCQAAYSLIWKPTGAADKVEEVTTPKAA